MSDEQERTRITGTLTLLNSGGACRVIVDDGSGKGAKGSVTSKASQQLEELEAARKKGYKQGWDECQKKMSGEIAALKVQLDEARNQVPEALNGYFSDLEAQMREEIVELAFKAAEAIVCAEIERRDITANAIRSALGQLISANGVKIHVSPSFLAKGVAQAPAGASFVSDPKLQTGEIMVDSPQGLIDGAVVARLAALKEELLKNLAQEPSNA